MLRKSLDPGATPGYFGSVMSQPKSKFFKFGAAVAIIVLSLSYLAWTGVNENKSFYVTIKEMHDMADTFRNAVVSRELWKDPNESVS